MPEKVLKVNGLVFDMRTKSILSATMGILLNFIISIVILGVAAIAFSQTINNIAHGDTNPMNMFVSIVMIVVLKNVFWE